MIESQNLGPVKAHVVSQLPLDVDMVIGLDLISRYGFRVGPASEGTQVTFGPGSAMVAMASDQEKTIIKDDDFSAWFEEGHWTAKWVWSQDAQTRQQSNRYYENVPTECRESFDAEIQTWIEEGILIPHDVKSHGTVKRFLPMIAVEQEKGGWKRRGRCLTLET